MTATAVDERSQLPGPTWPPSTLAISLPLTERRLVVLADDPCEAGFSASDPEYAGIYLHARYFDPKLGTFLSADPIGVAGGLNEYGYASGDPVNRVDPSGLACQKARSSTNGGPWSSWEYYGDCGSGSTTSPLPYPRTDYGYYPFMPFVFARTGYGSAARDGQQNYTAPLPHATADPPAGGENQREDGGTRDQQGHTTGYVGAGGGVSGPFGGGGIVAGAYFSFDDSGLFVTLQENIGAPVVSLRGAAGGVETADFEGTNFSLTIANQGVTPSFYSPQAGKVKLTGGSASWGPTLPPWPSPYLSRNHTYTTSQLFRCTAANLRTGLWRFLFPPSYQPVPVYPRP